MVKAQNSLISKILLIVLSFMLAFSCFMFSGCTPQEEGISLQSPFQTAYVKGENISFNNKEVTNIPNLTGGILKYVYQEDGAWKERFVDMMQAAINYNDSQYDASLDRLRIDGFNTNSSEGVPLEMSLYFLPAGSDVAFNIKLSYKIYVTGEEIAGARQTTEILYKINDILQFILVPLTSVVLTIGIVFVIVLVFNMSRASNGEQRTEAKKRIVYTIVGIAVAAALIIIFQLFSTYSIVWFEGGNFFSL